MAGNINIGSINLAFVASNQRFLQAAQQNSKALRLQRDQIRTLRTATNRLRYNVRRLISTMRRFAGVLGGLSIAGLVASLRSVSKEQASFGATLRETSIASGLSVRRLQLLRRAFEGNGVDIAATDKALIRLNKTFSESRTLATYRRQFEALGISVEELHARGAPLDEVLQLVADGLARVGSQAQRTEIAQQLFGRQGFQLLVTLQRGAEALNRQADSFERYGILTTAQAQRLKDLDQTYADTANVIRTQFGIAVAENVELFERFARIVGTTVPNAFRGLLRITQTLERHSRALRTILGAVFLEVLSRSVLARVASQLRIIVTTIGFMQGALFGLNKLLRITARLTLFGLSIEAVSLLNNLLRNTNQLAIAASVSLTDVFRVKTLDVFSSIVNFFGNLQERITTAFGTPDLRVQIDDRTVDFAKDLIPPEVLERIRTAQAEVDRLRDSIDGLINRDGNLPTVDVPDQQETAIFVPARAEQQTLEFSQRIYDSIIARNQALTTQQQLIGITGQQYRALVAEQEIRLQFEERLNELARRQISLIDRLATAEADVMQFSQAGAREQQSQAEKLRDQLRERLKLANANIESINKQAEAMDVLIDASQQLAEQQHAIAEATRISSERIDRLRNTARTIGDAFGEFAGRVITNFRDIGDAVKQLGQAIFDAIIRQLIVSPIANAITGAISGSLGIPGAQDGGLRSGLTIVGERGPELVDFRTQSRVYTNDELRAGLSDGGTRDIIFAPVINSSDGPAVRRALYEVLPAFEETVRNGLQRDAARRSQLRMAFSG